MQTAPNWDERESGASLVEYTLLLSLVAVVAVAALFLLGVNASSSLGQTRSGFDNTSSTTGAGGTTTTQASTTTTRPGVGQGCGGGGNNNNGSGNSGGGQNPGC